MTQTDRQTDRQTDEQRDRRPIYTFFRPQHNMRSRMSHNALLHESNMDHVTTAYNQRTMLVGVGPHTPLTSSTRTSDVIASRAAHRPSDLRSQTDPTRKMLNHMTLSFVDGLGSACVDPEVKRLKVKATQLLSTA